MKWYPLAAACLVMIGLADVVHGQHYSLVDLGTLGGCGSTAYAINDAGQVVGGSSNSEGHLRAFLWSEETRQDLGTLGGYYSEALTINNAGQIVGTATNSLEHDRAFLWSDGWVAGVDLPPSSVRAFQRSGRVAGWLGSICRLVRYAPSKGWVAGVDLPPSSVGTIQRLLRQIAPSVVRERSAWGHRRSAW